MGKGQIHGAITDVARIITDAQLSDRQSKAVLNYLNGLNKDAAAIEAGFAPGSSTMVFRGAKVQAVMAAVMDRFLVGELAPAAIHTISGLLADKATPPGVKATLALGVLDRAGFSAKRHEKADGASKDPSTMTPDELQAQIDKLQREIDAKMRDITPNDAPNVQQDIELYP